MNLADSTHPDVKGFQGGKALIPVGSIEQHGPHLPLATDSLIAEAVSARACEQAGALLCPTIVSGISPEHMDFPGTLSIEPDALKAIITGWCRSLNAHGISKIFVVNGHGGNSDTLNGLDVKGLKVIDLIGKLERYDHAGEVETSMMMYLHPGKVRVGEIREFEYKYPGKKKWRTIDYSRSGVLGDAIKASKDEGERLFNILVKSVLNDLED